MSIYWSIEPVRNKHNNKPGNSRRRPEPTDRTKIKETEDTEMVIDIHTHIFPDKIAEKATGGIEQFYDIKMARVGSVANLLNEGEAAGIDRFVVHSVATTPAQVEHINTFICETSEQYPDKLIGFATMHPDYQGIQKELERAFTRGLRGVKIHPDFQKFLIDDERAYPLYECIEGRVPLLVHTGDYRYEYSKPERMARVMDRFPKLDVIGAHFGGWSVWEQATDLLAGRRIWVDTSSSLYAITPDVAGRLIHAYGVGQVLFGSDFPMWTPKQELERFYQIPLTEEERERILWKNAADLLGLHF